MVDVRVDIPTLAARARKLSERSGSRIVIGIAGSPGAGKSTIADALLDALGAQAALVSMDGFHLDNRSLEKLGRLDRKGAPDTFDVDGFIQTLHRVREGGTVYAPEFDRSLDLSRAGAIEIGANVPIVLTEGNYLLSARPSWSRVLGLLDEAWWVKVDPSARVARLIDRHVRFGRDVSAAERWVHRSDEANAAVVADDEVRADLIIYND